MNTISPCPFCTAAAEMRETEDNANYIECTGCGASTNLQYSIKDDGRPDLIERWNNRAELGAGWQELLCCDDIRLDQGLAVAISDLQKALETAESRLAEAEKALEAKDEVLRTIANFAVGNGDVCEIIAKRARAALRPSGTEEGI